jgi:hypothetical protein
MTSYVDQALCRSNAWHPNDMFYWPSIILIKCLKSNYMFCWQNIVLTNAWQSNDMFSWQNIVLIQCLLAKWQVLLTKHCVDQMSDIQMTCSVGKTLCWLMPVCQMMRSGDQTLFHSNACWPNDKFCWQNTVSVQCLLAKWQVLLIKHCVDQILSDIQITSPDGKTFCHPNACWPNDKFCWQNIVSIKYMLIKWQVLLTKLCNDQLHFGRMTCSIDQTLLRSNAWNPRACSVDQTFCWLMPVSQMMRSGD